MLFHCWIISQYKACSYLHILISSVLLFHISKNCYLDYFVISQYSWSLFYPEMILMILKNVNDNLILLLKIVFVEEISSFQWFLKEIIVVFQKMFCVVGTSKRHQISIDIVQYEDKTFCVLTYSRKLSTLKLDAPFI